jgi:hypothetical protein
MKRLRHPIRAIREPFGTAGLIVACVALIAALGGTALAAAKLNGTQKKEVEKIAKKYAGKPGATGAAGTPGSQGAAGATGKDGAEGKAGPEGKEGPKGKEGKEGPEGVEGSPWTVYGTLPSRQTETGTWSGIIGAEEDGYASVSFAIQLAAPLDEHHVVIVAEGEEGEAEKCSNAAGTTKGTAEKPLAAPGFLCVYVTSFERPVGRLFEIRNAGALSGIGAARTGANLLLLGVVGEGGYGTWAVTAP